MNLRVICPFVLALIWASSAYAQQSPHADLLWHRALVLQARGDDQAEAVLVQACEAGSVQACLQSAATALTDEDRETAQDFLRTAGDVEPEDQEVRRALARLMAAQGNLIWATRDLMAMDQEGLEVEFELGYCLHELNQHERAVEHLVRAAEGGDEAPMAALYSAASLQALGREDQARSMVEKAAELGTGTEVEDAAQSMRDAFRGAADSSRVMVAGFATLAAGYDSNPVLTPDDRPAQAGGARLWFRGAVLGEPLGGSFWAIGGSAAVSRDQSFAETIRPFDFTSVRAQPHVRFNYGERVPTELRLAYRYGIGMLDGGQGVEVDEFYVYNEGHTGTLSYSLSVSPRFPTRLSVESGWSAFYNLARSGVPLNVVLGQSAYLLDGHLKLYAEAGFHAAWTRGPQYDRMGVSVSLAGAYLSPWWDLELIAGWSYRWMLYPKSGGVGISFDYTDPELRRGDSVNGVFLELGRDGHSGPRDSCRREPRGLARSRRRRRHRGCVHLGRPRTEQPTADGRHRSSTGYADGSHAR